MPHFRLMNPSIRRSARRKAQRGSMMIEVLISVLLLSGAVLGLVRVLAQSVKDSGELEYRSVASTIADETIGRAWVTDPANLAALDVTDEAVPQLPNGKRTVVADPATKIVTVTVSWQAPGAASASHQQVSATLARN